MLELDHIFIFTEVEAPGANRLIDIGLTEGSRNTHPGQGTSNRRFFFHNMFLEFLWVHDEKEVQSPVIAPTQLWERFDHRVSGFSPFGFCFRETDPDREPDPVFADAIAYKPPYLPEGLQIDVIDSQGPTSEPMLFRTPFKSGPPANYPSEKREKLYHLTGVKEITKVIVKVPIFTKMSPELEALSNKVDILRVDRTDYHFMIVEFDQGPHEHMHDFRPRLPLMIRW